MNANKKEVYSRLVIGCAYEVSNMLGAGFLENVYAAALARELTLRSAPFEREKALPVRYKDVEVGKYYADFMVGNSLIVEVKSLSNLVSSHEAQLLNYLKASQVSAGLLLNFGTPRVGVRRIVLDHDDTVAV